MFLFALLYKLWRCTQSVMLLPVRWSWGITNNVRIFVLSLKLQSFRLAGSVNPFQWFQNKIGLEKRRKKEIWPRFPLLSSITARGCDALWSLWNSVGTTVRLVYKDLGLRGNLARFFKREKLTPKIRFSIRWPGHSFCFCSIDVIFINRSHCNRYLHSRDRT